MVIEIFVDGATLRLNDEKGVDRPAILVRRGDSLERVHGVECQGPFRLVSLRPGEHRDGLPKVWLETEAEVRAIWR